MGMITEAIKEKLTKAFNPTQLDVIDESHKHAGHAGAASHAAEGGAAESHIHVVIVSQSFAGLGTLAKHRAVMDACAEQIAQIHAFSVEARAE